MGELQIYNNEEFGDIRTVTIENEPWFVGKDVAEALGYSNSRKALSDHVHDDDKGVSGLRLFPRPVASASITTTSVTGFAQFVSSPLQSLNPRNSTNVR